MARSIGRALGIGLSANTDKFSKGLKGAENDLEKFKRGVKRMGAAAAAGFAVAGAAALAFAKSSVDAYLEDEKSQRRLAKALQNTRGATKAQIKSVEDLILKYELQYGIADDKLRPAYQRLMTSTKSYSKTQNVLGLAMSISAGTGKDLQAVSNALAKGYDGNTASLSRLGVGLDKNLLKSGDMNKITAELAKTFKGQASAAADSYQGKMDRLSLKVTEFKENVGEKLMPVIMTFIDYIQSDVLPKLEAFFDGFTKGKKPLDDANEGAYQFGENLKNIVTWIKDNTGLVKTFATLIAGIFVGIKTAAAIAALGKLVGAFKVVTASAALAAGAEAAATGGASLALAGPAIAAIAAVFTVAGLSQLIGVGEGSPTVTTTSDYNNQTDAATKAAKRKAAYTRAANKKNTYTYQGTQYKWDNAKGEWYVLAAGSTGTYRDYSTPHPPGAPRASGGPVRRGMAYTVGERGPEQFIPNGQSGRIIPNNKMGGNNITFNLNGIVDADSARRAIEDVLRNSAKRLGPIDLIGSAL